MTSESFFYEGPSSAFYFRIGHRGSIKLYTRICHLDIAWDITNHVISMALSQNGLLQIGR